MHQFQELGGRPRLAQLLNHAKAHPAPAMHRYTGRFVDGDQVLVFEQDGELARGRRALGLLGHLV
ncbi:hypothetical protein D3C72_2433660 [compost metagenome]